MDRWIDVMSAFELSLFVRSSSVMTLRTGPHSALVPRLCAQLFSDWSGIDIAFVNDWHDLCQSTANWCQSSFYDCEIRGGISDAQRWVALEATGVRRCVSPFPRSLIVGWVAEWWWISKSVIRLAECERHPTLGRPWIDAGLDKEGRCLPIGAGLALYWGPFRRLRDWSKNDR